MPIDVMEQMRGVFMAEAMDLLIELDAGLLALEAEAGNTELVHRVFRAIHTIKGSGATAGYAHLARFAHKMEEAFDLAREGRLAVTPELIDCGLKACDVLRRILEEKEEEAVLPGELEASAAFAGLLPTSQVPLTEKTREQLHLEVKPRSAFDITFRPNREIFYSGTDPVTLLDDLRELGQAHITAHVDRIPALASLEPEHCYLWWDVVLITGRDEAAIRAVFVFVEDESQVTISLRDDQAAVALLGSVPAEMLEVFLAECEEHLAEIEREALVLERDPASTSSLDSLFRAVHSIKGNAGLLLGHVEGAALADTHPLRLFLQVSHGLESLLDPFRGETSGPVPAETVQTAIETCDAMRALLDRLTHGGTGVPVPPELLLRLGVRAEPAPTHLDPAARKPPGENLDARKAAFLNTTSQCFETIAGCLDRMDKDGKSTSPVVETYRRGLSTLSAAARYQAFPELEEPLALQLLILNTAVTKGVPLTGEERSILGKSFQTARSVLDRTAVDPTLPAKLAQVERATDSGPQSTIRIDQNKLDRLLRIVGELLVARGAFPVLIQKLNDGASGTTVVKDLKVAGSNISRIADELQSSVMSIRMLPIKTVFQRFPRLVRDLARSLGKEVRLVIEGEGIELDKTILEQIGDPLVHVIRNAVDHGLEPPEERIAKGKDPSGQLTLRAFHESGGVVIEVTEDGRGLDTAALKRKAVEKNLVKPDAAAAMTDEAAYQLVFLPGLTTAAKLTDVSGRGVGMDVVRSNVLNLRGTIEIRSQVGRGTTFLIKLPTSLMISKGILLEVGAQEYILPLSNIRDMVRLPLSAAHEYRGHTLAEVRGKVYSLFSLAEKLHLTPAKTTELSIAIVEAGAVTYGLVVDRFLTEVEVLVKPLTGGMEQCREFQGAAILGDGRVVLVLNALECHSLGRVA